MNSAGKSLLKHMGIKEMVQTAMLSALVFAVTAFIQVPIPLGYLNFGNFTALMGCLLIPSPCGIIAAAAGSALADLISWPVYAFPTLLIKGLMAFVFYRLMKTAKVKDSLCPAVSCALDLLVPVVGYTLTGMLIYGSFATGLMQLPGLLMEWGCNFFVFVIAARAVSNAVKVKK